MRTVSLIALVSTLALAPAASADKWNKGKGFDAAGPYAPGGPPGHVKHGEFVSNDRLVIQQYYAGAYGRGACPPGLAKKHNGCLPPGHAKRYMVGQPLAVGIAWYAVPHDLVVRLTPPPYGYRYIYLDGSVLLFNPSTRLVADAVSINVGINIR